MKKKLMMVAVLLGALSLGACVDNDESASVTGVREAKAEQLKSVAAMNNAEAAAKKVLADAQAALIIAQAEVEKANAQKIAAETAIAQKQLELLELQKKAAELANEAATTENEKRKEELKALQIENERAQEALNAQMKNWEVQKKQAEADLARIAAEMERQETEAQIALAQLQLELKQAQQDLVNYDQQIADAKTQAEKEKLEAEKAKLQQLSSEYANAVDMLILAKSTLTNMKKMLINLEAGLVTEKEMKQKAIADNNNTIAKNNTTIASYKKYANYTEDVSALRDKLADIDRESNLKRDEYYTVRGKLNSIVIDRTAYNEALEAIQSDPYYQFAKYGVWVAENGDRWTNNYFVGQYLNKGNLNSYSTEYEYKEYHNNIGYTYEFVNASFNKNMMDFRKYEVLIKDEIASRGENKSRYEKQLALDKEQYNGKAFKYNPVTGKYDISIRNAVDSVSYLKTEWEKEADSAKKAELEQLYKEAIDNENALKQNMDYYTSWIADAERDAKMLADCLSMFQNSESLGKALQEKVDALNKMDVALYADYITAWHAERDANEAYLSLDEERYAIHAILNGVGNQDGASWIASQIENLEDANATMEAQNKDLSNIESMDEAIAAQKARIEAQELVVKAKEAQEADLKAQLNAALKAAGITE